MRKIIQPAITIFLVILVGGNVFMFISGMKLADEINHYENRIQALQKENTDLEKKADQVVSFTYAASVAASLQFTKKAPLYIGDKAYALNQ